MLSVLIFIFISQVSSCKMPDIDFLYISCAYNMNGPNIFKYFSNSIRISRTDNFVKALHIFDSNYIFYLCLYYNILIFQLYCLFILISCYPRSYEMIWVKQFWQIEIHITIITINMKSTCSENKAKFQDLKHYLQLFALYLCVNTLICVNNIAII